MSEGFYLIEKEQLTVITEKERRQLEIHLAGCPVCIIFMQQSVMINDWARKMYLKKENSFSLPDDFKQQLQKRIDHLL